MERLENIVTHINRTLEIDQFKDYAPNGLQVEGKREVRKLVTGVTASLAFLEAALKRDADAVLVHHGYFWRGEPSPLTGMRGRRVATLMRHELSLLAYHLPLDVHPVMGNNAELGRRLGFRVLSTHEVDGVEGLVWVGEDPTGGSGDALVSRIESTLGRQALVAGDTSATVRRVGWCTGGGQRFVTLAAELGCQAFISGEISEQTTHEARESGLVYVGAGHHATERYGVQALGASLATNFDIEHEFIDIDNPA